MMTTASMIVPPLPEDTAYTARSLFGKGNIYLRLGEHIEELLDGIDYLEAASGDKRKAQTNLLYSLITVFQYMEELTEQQILDAVCNRVDLKYALHLPLIYSSFNPNALCEFRMQLSQEPDQRQAFQVLLDRLVMNRFLHELDECALTTAQIVDAHCTANRFEAVVEAMFLALEIIAATHADWLR
jgi:hypothetical protein